MEKEANRGLAISLLFQLLLFLIVYFAIAWRPEDKPKAFGIELVKLEGSAVTSESRLRPEPQNPSPEGNAKKQSELPEVRPEKAREEGLKDEVPVSNDLEALEKQLAERETGSESVIVEEEQPPAVDQEPTNQDNAEEAEAIAEVENTLEGLSTEPLDQRALFSETPTSGSENSMALELTGWEWDRAPLPEDHSLETGKIVYSITVDRDGYLIKVTLLSSNLTPGTEKLYRNAIESLTFSPTSSQEPAERSQGTITFVLKPD